MLEATIEVGRHFQGLEGSKKAAVNDTVNAKESSKDLPAQGCKLGRLKDSESLFFVIVIGKLGFIVHLVGDPAQYLVNVHGSGHGNGVGVAIAPSVLDTGRKAFAGSKRIEIGISGHDGPDGAHVIVEIDSVDRHPRGARFTRRQSDLRSIV
jgi:hypothetical protein